MSTQAIQHISARVKCKCSPDLYIKLCSSQYKFYLKGKSSNQFLY